MALFAAAVALSAGAGLSIAQETTDASRAKAHQRHNDSWGTGDGGQAGERAAAPLMLFSGVGSRGLTGNDDPGDAANQPEMATGVDLQGPPVQFRADDTPE